MAMVIKGKWTTESDAHVPVATSLDRWITSEPAEGAEFVAEAGRYHLYASLACPFAHRALAVRALMGLKDAIGLTLVSDIKRDHGWELDDETKPLMGAQRLHEVYTAFEPGVTSRASVPLLVDTKSRRIVSNDSGKIAKMFTISFGAQATGAYDLYPVSLRGKIDDLNASLNTYVNLGVYNVGFSAEQSEYETAVEKLFESLDQLEERLPGSRYLFGKQLTLSDLWLFATLVRFDAVYGPLFRCSMRRIADYPNLSGYLRDLMSNEPLAATVNLPRTKRHYYQSLLHGPSGAIDLNPTGLIPVGPEQDFSVPGDRDFLSRPYPLKGDLP